MEEIVAKRVFTYQCDFMWPRGSVDPGICPICKRNTIRRIPNLDYENYKLTNDLYVTYDRFFVVSEKFRHFCMYRNLEGLKFIKLPKTMGYFYFEPTFIYPLDNLRTPIKFEKFRTCCNTYDWIGGIPKCYGSMKFENERFCKRLIWELASSISMVVDLQTADEMVKEGFKGLIFYDVYYCDEEYLGVVEVSKQFHNKVTCYNFPSVEDNSKRSRAFSRLFGNIRNSKK